MDMDMKNLVLSKTNIEEAINNIKPQELKSTVTGLIDNMEKHMDHLTEEQIFDEIAYIFSLYHVEDMFNQRQKTMN